MARAYRGPAQPAGYGEPGGEPALRAAIAQHLAVARGVHVSAEDVVVTSGAQQAFTLARFVR